MKKGDVQLSAKRKQSRGSWKLGRTGFSLQERWKKSSQDLIGKLLVRIAGLWLRRYVEGGNIFPWGNSRVNVHWDAKTITGLKRSSCPYYPECPTLWKKCIWLRDATKKKMVFFGNIPLLKGGSIQSPNLDLKSGKFWKRKAYSTSPWSALIA